VYCSRRASHRLPLAVAVVQVARKIQELFQSTDAVSGLSSTLLTTLVTKKLPNIQPILDFFDAAFDHKLAEAQGSIIPKAVSHCLR
jgi:hypothetical protein